MRVLLLASFLLSICSHSFSQDNLVFKSGKRIAFSKIGYSSDEIDIKVSDSKKILSFDPDLVLGATYPYHEVNYYVKKHTDSTSVLSYQLLERLEVGKLNLYVKRNGPGQPEKTSGNFYLYLEKGNRLAHVFISNIAGKRKEMLLSVFSTFFADDSLSMAYINNPDFRFKMKEVTKAVQHYNRRNFISKLPNDATLFGSTFLYRTRFQKTKSALEITLFGQIHKLYIEDFIVLRLPVTFASRLRVYDELNSSEKIISSELTDQYFEVSYDKKTCRFIFEKKEGDELQYEFFKIKNKTIDN